VEEELLTAKVAEKIAKVAEKSGEMNLLARENIKVE
jgi:hypothetical protein